MKISLTQYGTEYAVNTNVSVDYNNPETLDETTCTEALEAFLRVLLAASFQEKTIEKAFNHVKENLYL